MKLIKPKKITIYNRSSYIPSELYTSIAIMYLGNKIVHKYLSLSYLNTNLIEHNCTKKMGGNIHIEYVKKKAEKLRLKITGKKKKKKKNKKWDK